MVNKLNLLAQTGRELDNEFEDAFVGWGAKSDASTAQGTTAHVDTMQ